MPSDQGFISAPHRQKSHEMRQADSHGSEGFEGMSVPAVLRRATSDGQVSVTLPTDPRLRRGQNLNSEWVTTQGGLRLAVPVASACCGPSWSTAPDWPDLPDVVKQVGSGPGSGPVRVGALVRTSAAAQTNAAPVALGVAPASAALACANRRSERSNRNRRVRRAIVAAGQTS
jgi:hypothetical protein